ncbi:hypothetical protein V5N11_002562 [Cardamine amara subsp. amara]|uniref:Uncharacterized protein n=1 Tax=Cardamine amara subsp. amara TaxID=228776 RepID=A0ABD1BH82_CARAN
MDHLFWRIPEGIEDDSFPWILWYILKARNDKVFKNVDKNPQETLQLGEAEPLAWESAQVKDNDNFNQILQGIEVLPTPQNPVFRGCRCHIDGSWKETDNYSGLDWCCSQDEVERTVMGVCNTQSPSLLCTPS